MGGLPDASSLFMSVHTYIKELYTSKLFRQTYLFPGLWPEITPTWSPCPVHSRPSSNLPSGRKPNYKQ